MKSRKNKEWVSCDYEVLPDYFIIGDEVANGGYTKRGMYALRGAQAQLLYSRGVPIVALCRDNTNKPIKSEDDLFEHNWLFGVSSDYEVLPDYFIIGDEGANGGDPKRGM